jgi:hypothetical protein
LGYPPIPECSGGGLEPGNTKPKLGSDCSPRKPDRHGFFQNRHSYFSNPSVYPRIGGLEPAACRKKAVFGTVRAGDHFPDRPTVPAIEECAVLGDEQRSRDGPVRWCEPSPASRSWWYRAERRSIRTRNPFCILPCPERGGGCAGIGLQHQVCAYEGVPGVADWHRLHESRIPSGSPEFPVASDGLLDQMKTFQNGF